MCWQEDELVQYNTVMSATAVGILHNPYWKVCMLRQRSLACRNYICAIIWCIISLKSECSRIGVAAWMTHMYQILGQLARAWKNEKLKFTCSRKWKIFALQYLYVSLLLMLRHFSTYWYKCFDSFVFNMETPLSTESGA